MFKNRKIKYENVETNTKQILRSQSRIVLLLGPDQHRFGGGAGSATLCNPGCVRGRGGCVVVIFSIGISNNTL
jgi:hypothetical protein